MRRKNIHHNPDSDGRVNHIFGIFEMGGSIASSLINKKAQDNANALNHEQWLQEMDYKLNRDSIEDARYEDEISYQRALQDKLFEREDTSILRQANQLSQLGVNPLSQSLSGLNSAPLTPQGSNRQVSDQLPQFRQNAYTGFNMALSSDFLNQIDQLQTNGTQRDLIQSQANYQRLVNMAYANRNGITLDENGNPVAIAPDVTEQEERQQNKEIREEEKRDKKYTANRNQRVDEFQYNTGANDTTSSTLQPAFDAGHQAHLVITGIKRSYDHLVNDFIPRVGDSAKTSLQQRLDAVKNDVFTFASNQFMKGQKFLKNLTKKNEAIKYGSVHDYSGRMR